jgi:cell division protein FtsI (penicillin-binding protein 3)
MAVMLLTFTLVFAAIAARLVKIQAISADHYLAVGLSQRVTTTNLPGQRGTIFDRSGQELAVSVPQTTIWADPQLVTDPQREASALAPLLGAEATSLESKLRSAGQFVYLAHKLDDATAAQVTGLKLPGVFGMAEPKRFQPAGTVASPLIGSVGADATGLSGLEQEYNQQLAGRPGKLVEEHDPKGSQIPGGLRQYQAPVNGQDLVLTIDEALQAQTEQALAAQIVAAKAKSGTAAVMDTRTGELLAVASLTTQPSSAAAAASCPATTLIAASTATATATTTASTGAPARSTTPSPACPPAPTPSASPFTNVFEPGSMSKLVTISAALEGGVVVPSDHFSVPDSLKLSDATFRDAESHPVQNWTVTDILANSSNVGTITIAQRLGKERLDAALAAFGFGQPTGVGFPGESAGLVPALAQWSATSIGTIAIGQGVAVTAIQMLAAYNAIANGGVYVAPKLVAATVDAAGQTHPTAPSAEHRVVSPVVAQDMTTMLGEVVRVGTGQTAKINGYSVAGKTGTALIALPGARGYMNGVYTSGFAGFVPAEHPDLTTIVVIDQTPLFGGVAAAPLFSTVAGDALREFRIAPLPAQPPAPGVPLATPATAQAAGEILPPLGTAPKSVTPAAAAATGKAVTGKVASRAATTATTSALAHSPPTTATTLARRASPGPGATTTTSQPAKR